MILYMIFKCIVIAYALKPLGGFLGELVSTGTERVENYWAKIGMYLSSYLLTCSKCFSFWFALVISGDLLIAAITSIIISLIEDNKLKLFKDDKN